jgi:hypothetical protein
VRVKLEVGAELDLLSPKEFKDGLRGHHDSWLAEMAQGFKEMRFNLYQVPVAGEICMGGDAVEGAQIGPREGYVWAIQRISVLGSDATDVISLTIGMAFVAHLLTANPSYHTFGKQGLILHPGELLNFVGTSIGSADITINGSVIECPGPKLWQLIK